MGFHRAPGLKTVLASTMHSEDEAGPSSTQIQEHRHVKRRRLHGACDICRRKKIKCNSAEMPNKICSNCIAYNLECTHNIPRHASKKETEKGYIHALEERLDKMEQLLRTVRPEIDIDHSDTNPNSPASVHSAPTPHSVHSFTPSHPVSELPYPSPQNISDSVASRPSPSVPSNASSDEEDLAHISLSEQLSKLAVESVEDRFFGKSSAFMFIHHASSVKHEIVGQGPVGRNLRRPVYWDLRPWEIEFVNSDSPQFIFPDKDLITHLISVYFETINIYIPLLHRPTFEKDISNDLHYHDAGFGQLVLILCALASRNSDDPRIMLQGDTAGLSAGWKWFKQTKLLRNMLLNKASLYDLQYYCLVVPYLLASSLPQAAWNILGLAIRLLQERGVHRRRGEGHRPTIADELWKRCFWSLVAWDRLTSSFVGRTCAIHDEDFDADLPIECDDEYWDCEDSDLNWKQPLGKPSKITAFNVHLRLCEILAFALRTIYSTKKSKILTGLIGDEWEQRVVTELDSSMNRWKDSLPNYLRWDPNQENQTFLQQSAFLHVTFHYLQIQVHRPFIQKKTPLSFPSLAICTNAARACSHILDARGAGWIYPFPNFFISAFASGIVLLLHIYGGKRAGLNTDLDREMKNVQRCMECLRSMEKRWHLAGRLHDILTDFATMQQGQFIPDTRYVSNKRSREEFKESDLTKPNRPPNPVRPLKVWPGPKNWSPALGNSGHNITPRSYPSNYMKQADDVQARVPIANSNITPPTPLSPTLLSQHNPLSSLRQGRSAPSPAVNVVNDLDLSNFLLTQMNYIQPNGASLLPQNGPQIYPNVYPTTMGLTNDGSRSNTYHGSRSPNMPGSSGGMPAHTPSPPFIPQSPTFSQDMAAVWSDAPNNFNFEEWDHFVASSVNGSGAGAAAWNYQNTFNNGNNTTMY